MKKKELGSILAGSVGTETQLLLLRLNANDVCSISDIYTNLQCLFEYLSTFYINYVFYNIFYIHKLHSYLFLVL